MPDPLANNTKDKHGTLLFYSIQAREPEFSKNVSGKRQHYKKKTESES